MPKRSAPSVGATRLLCVFSPLAERVGDSVVLSSRGQLQLGREAARQGSSFVLEDSLASRQHAQVRPNGDRFEINDQGSRNGTFVGGEAVDSWTTLADGDILRLGSHLLLVQELTLEECRRVLVAPGEPGVVHGPSLRLEVLRAQIRRWATKEVPVLIQGESGAGKELCAEQIHRDSGKTGDFVAVNCAALPAHLVESELFGHKRGAFTGADRTRTGLFQQAEGGTLFLDEIGELSMAVQAKLLRALATGEIRPLGDTATGRVDTRVVAATNIELEAAVDQGGFRGDLYSRLMGVILRVPPLRSRREDVLPLARLFLAEGGASTVTITADAAEALLLAPFRYNVRELKQVMVAAAPAAQEACELDLGHLPSSLSAPVRNRLAPATKQEPSFEALLSIRRDVSPSGDELRTVVDHFEGNISRVAEFFGKRRRQIYRWIERFEIDLAPYRDEG